METKFDNLKRFITARDPGRGKILDEFLATLNEHQIHFLKYAVETFRGSGYVKELGPPRIDTKDLIDPYVFCREPVRACKEALQRAYDPEAEYPIQPDLEFKYHYLFKAVMPRLHKYDMKTGRYTRSVSETRSIDPVDQAYNRLGDIDRGTRF